eukprot:scaffold15024_cov200-Alexandrium_tamarense.AAC.1
MGERIRALEQMQMQQNGQQPQAIYYAQPPVQQQQMAPASAHNGLTDSRQSLRIVRLQKKLKRRARESLCSGR